MLLCLTGFMPPNQIRWEGRGLSRCDGPSYLTMKNNFARVHQTLHVTPAMEAGIADHVWSLEEITKLI